VSEILSAQIGRGRHFGDDHRASEQVRDNNPGVRGAKVDADNIRAVGHDVEQNSASATTLDNHF
jgi:hypothetical protein